MYPLASQAREFDHEANREQLGDKYTVYENRPNVPHLDSARNPLYSQSGRAQNNQDIFGGRGRGGPISYLLGKGLKILDH